MLGSAQIEGSEDAVGVAQKDDVDDVAGVAPRDDADDVVAMLASRTRRSGCFLGGLGLSIDAGRKSSSSSKVTAGGVLSRSLLLAVQRRLLVEAGSISFFSLLVPTGPQTDVGSGIGWALA